MQVPVFRESSLAKSWPAHSRTRRFTQLHELFTQLPHKMLRNMENTERLEIRYESFLLFKCPTTGTSLKKTPVARRGKEGDAINELVTGN